LFSSSVEVQISTDNVRFGPRLALKAFGEQKKRFFPSTGDNFHSFKRGRAGTSDGSLEDASLAHVLRRIQTDAPGMAVTPFVRLEWGKRTSSINLSKAVSDPTQALASLPSQSLSPVKLEPGTAPIPPSGAVISSIAKSNEKVAVLEVTISGILRAIISLHPMGSVYPDALAVFSPDEVRQLLVISNLRLPCTFICVLHKFWGKILTAMLVLMFCSQFGGYVHAWGISQHKLHQRISVS
jgi:hypothetical protein